MFQKKKNEMPGFGLVGFSSKFEMPSFIGIAVRMSSRLD